MSETFDAARHVPAGGSATVNGVLYQMLWTLLRASRATLAKSPLVENDELQEVTIVLEPAGGGGDLVARSAGKRSVEQIKARPDGRAWSLREVVAKVIPDLYLATLNDRSDAEFRFITEGKIGTWKKEYAFFRSIASSSCPKDPLSDIDDSKPLWSSKGSATATTTNKSGPFWERDSYTARELFLEVVSAVRSRKAVETKETETQTQKNLRSVLANFEFVGGQFMLKVQREIDSLLLAVVSRNDEVPKVRDSLAMELVRLATEGNSSIECETLFQKVGLNAIPLTQWATLRRRSQYIAKRNLSIRGYTPSRDVRTKASTQLLNYWPDNIPVLAITGESGSGKSWCVYSVCLLAQATESLCVTVAAGANFEETFSRASATVWEEIAGHDAAIPLYQISARVQKVLGTPPSPWLTIAIDGIFDLQHARELILQPWEDWGIRLVLTLGKREAALLKHEVESRCRISSVHNFSTTELHAYLSLFLGDNWPDMPEFMRDILKVPLLANVFRQIMEASGNQYWIPHSEYELIEQFWSRINYQKALDTDLLIQLGEKYLLDGAYPWRIRDVSKLGIDNDTIPRLEQAGWLKLVPSTFGNQVECVHLRLLNWMCAVALVDSRQGKRSDLARLCKDVLSFFEGSSPQHGHMLCFVPMDVIWLMCQSPDLRNEVPAVIASLEGDYSRTKFVYGHLLPTIGSAVIDALIWRLREKIDDWFVPSLITTSLRTIGGDAAIKAALVLLDDENPLLQLCACDVFAGCPSSEPVDKLWKLHNECRSIPDKFLREREKKNAPFLRDRTFPALKECCRICPDWLVDAIKRANPTEECVADLAYLLSGIEPEQGSQLWKMVKTVLFSKIPDSDQRAIAVCIDTFSDKDEVQWLTEVLNKSHFIGASSAKALARFEPLQTIGQLHNVPLREMIHFRPFIFNPLFTLEPEATRRRITELMIQNSNPWEVAELYDGRSHYMDAASLDVLLAELQRQLGGLLSGPDWGDSEPLYRELHFLAQIRTTVLIQHLRRQAGTSLEASLTKFILRIGQRSWDGSLNLRNAVPVLFRIGGDGFTTVVNEMLASAVWHVRLEAILLADRRPNEETFARLTSIVSDLDERDHGYLEQSRAAVVLASHGKWAPVIDYVVALGKSALVTTLDFPGIQFLPDMGCRAPSDLLKSVSEVLQACPRSGTAGQVLALGFGAPETAAIVRIIAEVCDPKSDVAFACVVALDMLHDHASESVGFLNAQLQIKEHNFVATNALIRNGTQAAMDALESFAGIDVSGAVAINLIRHSAEKQRVLEKVSSRVVRLISSRVAWDDVAELYQLIKGTRDATIATTILSQQTVAEYLAAEAFADEGNVWLTGSKFSAIKCLAYIDPNSALVAAKAALRSTSRHDREFYPPIIAELDPKHAATLLIEVLASETSDLVRKSIGRTMHSLNAEAEILDALKSADTEMQVAGCFCAGWFNPSVAIREQLVAKIRSSPVAVSDAAVAAMNQLAVRNDCSLLGQEMLNASDPCDRWLYLSCLVELADCGDDRHLWPVGGPVIGDAMTPLQTSFANKQLDERRDKEKRGRLV